MAQDKNRKLIAQILSGSASSYDKTSVLAALALAFLIHVFLIEYLPKNFHAQAQSEEEIDELELEIVPPELEKVLPEYIEANPEANNQKPDSDTRLESFQDQRAAQENPDENSDADKPRTEGEVESQKIVSGDASEEPMPSSPQEVFDILERPLENANPQNPSPGREMPAGARAAAEASNQEPEKSESEKSLSPIAEDGDSEDKLPSAEQAAPEIEEMQAERDAPTMEELVPQSLPSPKARPRISMRTPAGPVRNSNTDASAVGTIAVSSRFSEFGAYQQRMIEAISRQWYLLASNYDLSSAIGTKVQVEFKLNARGEITSFKTPFSTSTQIGTKLCETAIESTAPYGNWTEEMLVTFGSQDQSVSIMFYYY